MKAFLLSLAGVLVLAGCASAPPRPGGTVAPTGPEPAATAAPAPAPGPVAPPAPPTPAQQRTAAASTLAVERQWLASWFKGTPVVVAQRPDGAVTVDVPREFCFEPGRDAVKPALAAVLDKVAESLRRTAVAEIRYVGAPGDAGGAATLAAQRAARVHDYLRKRGVAPARLAAPTAGTGTAVQLRIEAASPA
jgi:outer membrane protein OmpA-like peptidoglycan-associated protein